MAKPILIANWKNHPSSLKEAANLLTTLNKKSRVFKKTTLFIAPPLTYLALTKERAQKIASLASQSISLEESGTHTGLVTPDILKSFGVKLSIIGHSEMRELGETNEDVAKKIKIAEKAGIVPLVCVGEKTRDEAGEHLSLLREEIKSSLSGISKAHAGRIVIAYEPVWAIGKKSADAIEPVELAQTVMFIKKVLADIFGRDTAEKINIIYGGSVEPANAKALIKDGGVRGFLVGHASLDAKMFAAIAEAITS